MGVLSGKGMIKLWNTSLQHVVKSLQKEKETEIYDELLYTETYLTHNISDSQVVKGWKEVSAQACFAHIFLPRHSLSVTARDRIKVKMSLRCEPTPPVGFVVI